MHTARPNGRSRSGAILRHLPWVIVVMVVSAGFLLIPGRIKPEWSFGLDTDVRTNLGSSLLGGAVIGVVLLALERQTVSRAESRALLERAEAITRERAAVRHIVEMWVQSVIDEVIVGPLKESIDGGMGHNDPIACDWWGSCRNGTKVVSETVLGETTTRRWRSVPVFSTHGHDVVRSFLSHVQSLPVSEQVKFFTSERVGVIRDWVSGPSVGEVSPSSRREELTEILRDMTTTFSTRLVDLGDLDGVTLLWKARSEVARTPREWSPYRGFEDDALVQSLQKFLELGQSREPVPSRFDDLPMGTGARINLYDGAQLALQSLGFVDPRSGFEYEPRKVYTHDPGLLESLFGPSDPDEPEDSHETGDQGLWASERYVLGGREVPIQDLPWDDWLRVTWVESMRQHGLRRVDPTVENSFLEILRSSFECSWLHWSSRRSDRGDQWYTLSLQRPDQATAERVDLTKPLDLSFDWPAEDAEPDDLFAPNFTAYCSQYWDVFTAIRMVYRKYEHSLTNNFWWNWMPVAQVEWIRRRGLVGGTGNELP